ncbi:MAG: hypothetical protein NVSMB57_09390 [Actinomycetota bacterium]
MASKVLGARTGARTRKTNDYKPAPENKVKKQGATSPPTQSLATEKLKASNVEIQVPFLGPVELPPRNRWFFYAAVIGLGIVEIVEWPIVAVIAVGHFLADQHHNQRLEELGELLEEVE